MHLPQTRIHKPDYPFIIGFIALLVFGLLVLSSASAPTAISRFNDAYFYIKRQILFGAVPGLVLFFIFMRLNYRALKPLMWTFFGITVVLLVVVFIPGLRAEFGTARSWIVVFGASVQPSEIAKMFFILFLALWLEHKGPQNIQNFKQGILPFLGIIGSVGLLLILQPDVGTLAIFLSVSFVMVFLAGARVVHLVLLGGLGVLALVGLIAVAPYRAHRVTTFLHPELDPQGVGYQINQAFLAIGSGGPLGLGYGHSRQKFQYLPEVISDSVFAVMAEELGFLGAAGYVVVLLWIFRRSVSIAKKAPDLFGALVVYGVSTWFIVQSFFNIGAMAGLMPLTGLPLPLVSHGGTALMAILSSGGLIASASRQTR
jgi:cell division protein FtsW